MGEAKRRKAEIEMLKRLGPPIDVTSPNPEPAVVLARRLHSMFETAKQDGNIDPPVEFVHAKLDTTIHAFGPLPVACKKGCSHCCYIWVSATAPELLFIAKMIRSRGDQAIERVRTAHLQTKEFSLGLRVRADQAPCLQAAAVT
jgi:hypothetical protein